MTASVTSTKRRSPVPADLRRPVAVLVTTVAAVAVATSALLTVVANTPGGAWLGQVLGPATGVTALIAALAAVALALTATEPIDGVGLLFVGVFGGLATLVPTATVPAAVAVVGGTAVTVGSRMVGALTGSHASRIAAGILTVSLAVGVTSGIGGLWSLRAPASMLALLGVAAMPAYVGLDSRSLVGSVVVFSLVIAAGLAAPFVTGAVTLTWGGIVGASLPLVALAAAGAVATGSAALRERRWVLLAGVVLIAGAGVPASLDRAVPFALGLVALATTEVDR